MGGARGHRLPFAQHMMKRIVGAEADHVATGRILDQVVLIAQASGQRFYGYAAGPARQRAYAVFDGLQRRFPLPPISGASPFACRLLHVKTTMWYIVPL